MDDKKKEFIIPKAELVNFIKEDIIVTSAGIEDYADDDFDNDNPEVYH